MRRKIKTRKELIPDLIYNSVLATKFINRLMRDGKKSVAQKVFYNALNEIKNSKIENPFAVFETALKNVTPAVEVRSRRIGGANYQVPREVRTERKNTLAIRWLVEAARAKKGKPMSKKLAEELILASKNEGGAVKKRENIHKMAEANKAFAHFAW